MTPIETAKRAIESGSIQDLVDLEQLVGPSFLDAKDARFQRTPLHFAARQNRPDILTWLLDHGANIEAMDIDGSRPLHVAAMNGSHEALAVLLDRGAAVDPQRQDGKTPLLMAQSLLARGPGFQRCAQTLSNRGANPNAKDNEGKTGSDHAEEIANSGAKSPTPSLGISNPLSHALESELTRIQQMSTPQTPRDEIKPATTQPENSVAPMGAPRDQALKALLDLGFERIAPADGAASMQGRENEADELSTLLDKGKSAILVGKAGSGKRSLAKAAAERLSSKGKIVLAVPSSAFRGNKYAGSVNENIQKWMGHALSLGDELVLFINDAHQLSTGKTSSDTTDTPLQILRERLDPRKDNHLTLLLATTPKEVTLLAEDEAFMSALSRRDLGSMSAEETLRVLTSPAGTRQLLRDYPEVPASEVSPLAKIAVDLCDKYLFNLAFPGKAFDFMARALALKAPSAWTSTDLTEFFCKSFSVPREIALGRMTVDSPYYQLEPALNAKVIGQEGPISEISEAISSQIVLANPSSHRPVSMLFAGPTGVGKTETSETIAQTLGLPLLSLPMGEFKTPYDTNALKERIMDFCAKNYSGVILLDEIEKSAPQVRDVLLNLFDKGVVGSGPDAASCGFMICIATTNVGSREAVAIKRQLRETDGNPKIHESWIRNQMIDAGFLPEFVNRIGLACDFNDITHDSALKIAQQMFNSQAKALSKTRGIELVIDASVAKEHAADVFNPDFGARGIRRCVETTLARTVAQRELALAIAPGARIHATSKDGILTATARTPEGSEVTVSLKPKDDNKDLLRLEHAQKALASFSNLAMRAAQLGTSPTVASASSARP